MKTECLALGVLGGLLLAGCAPREPATRAWRIDVPRGADLGAVIEKVRALPASNKVHGVEIVLASGDYAIRQTLGLDARDSGLGPAAPVVWRAKEPGKARLVCAERVPASLFAPVKDPALLGKLVPEARGKVLQADVSGILTGKVEPMALSFHGRPTGPWVFVNQDFGTLARWPNAAYASFTKRVDTGMLLRKRSDGGNVRSPGAFVFSDARAKRWDFAQGVWMRGFWTHDWDSHAVKAASYGEENGTNDVIRLATAIPYGVMNGTWGRKERRLYFFNLFEEIDAPGEWYLDRARKILYLYPPAGRLAAHDEIYLSNGQPAIFKGEGVSHLRFEGLTFAYSSNSGVLLAKTENVAFSRCTFTAIGATGLSLSGSRSHVADCEIKNIGAAGLSIGGGDRARLIRADSRITRNKIHNFGVFQRTYAPGISLNGCGTVCSHNEIFNAPHSAVIYGGNEHLFEYNDVHDVLLETGDAGAFYTGRDWTTQGNVLRYNFVHELGAEGDHANTMGFYFDDCDCGDEVTGNVFWKVSRGIMIGGGREHPVRHNVFAECLIGLSIDNRGMTWRHWNSMEHGGPSWMLEEKAKRLNYTQEPWKSKYPRLANIMKDAPREPLYNPVEENVFINCKKSLLFLSGGSMDTVIPKCSFKDNLVFVLPPMETGAAPDRRIEKAYRIFAKGTDTGFVDPLKGDFRLKEGGCVLRELPAFDLGKRFSRLKDK